MIRTVRIIHTSLIQVLYFFSCAICQPLVSDSHTDQPGVSCKTGCFCDTVRVSHSVKNLSQAQKQQHPFLSHFRRVFNTSHIFSPFCSRRVRAALPLLAWILPESLSDAISHGRGCPPTPPSVSGTSGHHGNRGAWAARPGRWWPGAMPKGRWANPSQQQEGAWVRAPVSLLGLFSPQNFQKALVALFA